MEEPIVVFTNRVRIFPTPLSNFPITLLYTASAFSADNTNKELCDASMTAYLAVIDAECTGYNDLPEESINYISTMCDYLLDTEAVYGCTDPDAPNYDSNATTPCNSGTDNDCCMEGVVGCTDIGAINYDQNANIACSDCCQY